MTTLETIVLVAASLFLLILSYTLLTPVQLVLNSKNHWYGIRIPGLMECRVLASADAIILQLKMLWLTKKMQLLPRELSSTKTKVVEHSDAEADGRKQRKSKSSFPFSRRLAQGLRMLKSFQVRRCDVGLDTGDDEINAQLIPVAYLLGRSSPCKVSINFVGINSCDVLVENRVIRLLWAFMGWNV